MKKFLLATALCLATTLSINAQMSDKQIISFIAKEQKAGTNQAQIVTKLMQRGVKIEQIQRLRNQYSKKISQSGLRSQADAAVEDMSSRMRQTENKTQELVSGKTGTDTAYSRSSDSSEHCQEYENRRPVCRLGKSKCQSQRSQPCGL